MAEILHKLDGKGGDNKLRHLSQPLQLSSKYSNGASKMSNEASNNLRKLVVITPDGEFDASLCKISGDVDLGNRSTFANGHENDADSYKVQDGPVAGRYVDAPVPAVCYGNANQRWISNQPAFRKRKPTDGVVTTRVFISGLPRRGGQQAQFNYRDPSAVIENIPADVIMEAAAANLGITVEEFKAMHLRWKQDTEE